MKKAGRGHGVSGPACENGSGRGNTITAGTRRRNRPDNIKPKETDITRPGTKKGNRTGCKIYIF
ncbi:MAG: hypothetical protein IJ181_06455 [Acidaminococcaceae bacterium]|nr:hypothetical protein [Acidaminococcaceae bacterium]